MSSYGLVSFLCILILGYILSSFVSMGFPFGYHGVVLFVFALSVLIFFARYSHTSSAGMSFCITWLSPHFVVICPFSCRSLCIIVLPVSSSCFVCVVVVVVGFHLTKNLVLVASILVSPSIISISSFLIGVLVSISFGGGLLVILAFFCVFFVYGHWRVALFCF